MSQPSSAHIQPYSLADYGWDEACEHAFVPHRAAGSVPARVVRAECGPCEVATDAGIVRAGIPGTDDSHSPPCTGESAALQPATAGLAAVETGEITRRRLGSYRKPPRENACAASRTDARPRADREAVEKDIARHVRATHQFRERRQ